MEKLISKMNELQLSLTRKDDKIAELEEHILTLETGQQIQKKKRKLNSESEDDLMIKITEQECKIQQLIKENEDLKCKKVTVNALAETENTSRNTTLEIMNLIEEKLNSGLCSIKENVNQLIDAKLNNMTAQTT